jgi:hypothetical protein
VLIDEDDVGRGAPMTQPKSSSKAGTMTQIFSSKQHKILSPKAQELYKAK